jgi:hypothetical protein
MDQPSSAVRQNLKPRATIHRMLEREIASKDFGFGCPLALMICRLIVPMGSSPIP